MELPCADGDKETHAEASEDEERKAGEEDATHGGRIARYTRRMVRFAVWFVAGCTCPSFADMVVTDPDDLADDTFEAEIADGIATFAAWTGRDGVCVPEVRILPDVAPEAEVTIGGAYIAQHVPIAIRAGVPEVGRVTTHELCHALDDVEGHSTANPTVFPAGGVAQSLLYPTDALRGDESFARACEDGPSSNVSERLDVLCGVGGDPKARYLDAHVFAAGTPFSDETVPMSVTERTLTMTDPIIAVGASDDMLLVVTTDRRTVRVTEVDPGTGESQRTMEVAAGTDVVAAQVAPGLVLLTRLDASELETEVLAFDLDTAAVDVVGSIEFLPFSSTHSDGIAYAAGSSHPGPSLRAWDLTTGEELPIAASPLWGSLEPTDGGLLVFDGWGGLARYDRSADRWMQEEIPGGWVGWRHGTDGLLYILHGGDTYTPALYDLDTDTWRLVDPPCQDLGRVSGFRLTVGNRHLMLQQLDWTPTLSYVEVAG